MSNIPTVTIRELLDAGVHFGHKKMRWNPKMAPFLYGIRDDIHIIDLQQTQPLFNKALETVYEVAKRNGKILFVATKQQASDIVAEGAARCGQYYVNHRWLGGMMTNWITVSASIKTLEDLEQIIADDAANPDTTEYTKKEILDISRKMEKLERSLGGIRTMNGRPDLVFVIDTNKEDLAVKEANRLGIPVVAILDSNSDPAGIDFPVPGNDDATRAIKLYCKLVSDAVLAGIQTSMVEAGIDIGEAENFDIAQLTEKRDANKNKIKKIQSHKKVKVGENVSAETMVAEEAASPEFVEMVEAATDNLQVETKKKPAKKVEAAATEEAPAKAADKKPAKKADETEAKKKTTTTKKK